MAFGGKEPEIVGVPNMFESAALDLQNLTFFDPKTKKRHWQMATGDVPRSPRTATCIAGFQNPDGGYEM
jgi:hypothetical protein